MTIQKENYSNTPPQSENGSTAPATGVTVRSVVIGLICVVVACWGCLYSNMIQKSSYMAGTLMSVAVIFIFVLVVLGLNTLIKLVRRRSALTRAELAVIFIMTLLATCLPTFGWGEMFYPYLTSFRYYARPSNRWHQTLHPEIAKSRIPLLPSENNRAIQHFYEGVPGEGRSFTGVMQRIPWGDWAAPLAWWTAFFLPLFFLMLCVTVILRKQLIERERLIFPLMQVPLEIIKQEDQGSLINRFFKNRLLWMGVLLPVTWDLFRALSHYWVFVPSPPRFWQIDNVFGFWRLHFQVNWVMMGFAYLISPDVGFSLWFFSLAKTFGSGLLKHVGYNIGEGGYYTIGVPAVAYFTTGAMFVLVGMQLWAARRHLRDVLRKAFLGARDVDDSKETMSYRLAVLGGIVCFLWLWLWWYLAGMQWWLPPVILVVAFVIFLAITRLVIEGGVPTANASLIPQTAVVRLLGTSVLTPQSIVCMGLCFTWIADLRVIMLPFMAHGVRMADAVRMRRRSLPWLITVTTLVAMVVTTVVLFYLCYREGGINLNSWFFVGGGCKRSAQFAHHFITKPVTWDGGQVPALWGCVAAGGVSVAFLSIMRVTFTWWPLNPIGLPFWIPGWASVMVAWVIKFLVLKYGGVRLFRKLKPIFMGFILGQFLSAGTWFLIDMGSGVIGNVLYNR